jgi:hypothetical protein
MPRFCDYKNCHNLASSTYRGYCNEYHFNRAMLEEKKEEIKRLEELVKTVKKEETHLISSEKKSEAK